MKAKFATTEQLKSLTSTQNIATASTVATGLGLTALRVATLKTSTVTVTKTSATTAAMVMTTAKASILSKVIVGGLGVAITAAVGYMVYLGFEGARIRKSQN